MHACANVFAPHSSEADAYRNQIIAVNQGRSAGLIDGFPDRAGAIGHAHAQGVRGTSLALANHTISVQNYGSGPGTAAVDAGYQLSMGCQSPGQNIDSMRGWGHFG